LFVESYTIIEPDSRIVGS